MQKTSTIYVILPNKCYRQNLGENFKKLEELKPKKIKVMHRIGNPHHNQCCSYPFVSEIHNLKSFYFDFVVCNLHHLAIVSSCALLCCRLQIHVRMYVGAAIWCYVCNSGEYYEKDKCSSITDESAHLKKDCDNLPSDLGRSDIRNYTLCRKFIQDGKMQVSGLYIANVLLLLVVELDISTLFFKVDV